MSWNINKIGNVLSIFISNFKTLDEEIECILLSRRGLPGKAKSDFSPFDCVYITVYDLKNSRVRTISVYVIQNNSIELKHEY